jgi:cytochrome c peroxidase
MKSPSVARILTFLAVLAAFAGRPILEAQESVPLPKGLPGDLWELLIPPDNPMTAAKIDLGRRLYFDKRLSKDGSVSCATCHDPAKGFADGRVVAEGIRGQKGARNSPTVLNAVFNELQFWDGRAATLEEQAKGPFINPVEMGFANHDEVVAVVQGVPDYTRAFQAVFGGPATIDRIAAAIAAFERTVVSGNSPFDRFIAGDTEALSEPARRGWALFNGKARCNTCHGFNSSSPNFTDNKFHNIGVAAKTRDFASLARQAASFGTDEAAVAELAHRPDAAELGRFLVTRQPKDLGAFKTPGLRDIALTAPYMHDGSEPTLAAVIDFYDKGGEQNPYLDGGIVPLKLTHEEKAELHAFLESLTGQAEGAADRPALRAPQAAEGAR